MAFTTKKPNAAFFQAIGKSLVTWQYVEDALARVFQAASTCQSAEVARAIFFSPNDFGEKLKMTHNALRTPLRPKGALDAWLTQGEKLGLRGRMIKESEFRNALAHFAVGEEWHRERGHRHILMPTLSDPNEETRRSARKNKLLDALDVDAIREAGTRFDALAKDIEKFAREIALAPETLQFQARPPESIKRSSRTNTARGQSARPTRKPRLWPPFQA
jgi:hypothetical protein